MTFVQFMRRATDNVTGSIDRGTLAGVMGGSGAGKSTFVNVLMGKTSNIGGVVAVNNSPSKVGRYKKVIGHVPEETFSPRIDPLREHYFHGIEKMLILKPTPSLSLTAWNYRMCEIHKSEVLRRQSQWWTTKSVSIGMELAAVHMAIFLDEPTSGLDATSASSMIRTLKVLARLGIAVIFIIHQPWSEVFDLFDSLFLVEMDRLFTKVLKPRPNSILRMWVSTL
ncbi:ATP-binding cassette transporter, putative [Talaromyces stipitatus ATCC 10500]|uniref:ATP-binding cassette transporter, putative n=1 Tax=Talaromyces stipitatus (strain ATCC 10500 / CBS 375.48 / QM 6759 / NRRL 1006) TaxID=441959 RepID=B8MM42_TALSN|nr:ATP-binding cassette transporter, putative [Talaromyces stipitatus ATCC 10500]EED13554.1 ATP-binding cassette transporter, putative [Talaromyces stipitatus ATCC 10500]